MVADSEELVPIPYPFKHNEKRTILAFAYEQHNRDAAVEAGAEIALGPDMIKKVWNKSIVLVAVAMGIT